MTLFAPSRIDIDIVVRFGGSESSASEEFDGGGLLMLGSSMLDGEVDASWWLGSGTRFSAAASAEADAPAQGTDSVPVRRWTASLFFGFFF